MQWDEEAVVVDMDVDEIEAEGEGEGVDVDEGAVGMDGQRARERSW